MQQASAQQAAQQSPAKSVGPLCVWRAVHCAAIHFAAASRPSPTPASYTPSLAGAMQQRQGRSAAPPHLRAVCDRLKPLQCQRAMHETTQGTAAELALPPLPHAAIPVRVTAQEVLQASSQAYKWPNTQNQDYTSLPHCPYSCARPHLVRHKGTGADRGLQHHLRTCSSGRQRRPRAAPEQSCRCSERWWALWVRNLPQHPHHALAAKLAWLGAAPAGFRPPSPMAPRLTGTPPRGWLSLHQGARVGSEACSW